MMFESLNSQVITANFLSSKPQNINFITTFSSLFAEYHMSAADFKLISNFDLSDSYYRVIFVTTGQMNMHRRKPGA